MKYLRGLLLLGMGLTIVACGQNSNANAPQRTPVKAASNTTSETAAKKAPERPVISTEPSTESSTEPTAKAAASIYPGRYWLGSTSQALDVEGDQYRYNDEEGAQPWQPLSNLRSIKPGVLFDGQTYWCLSTMAPKSGGAIACSENGWVTAKSEPKTGDERKLLFSCATEDVKQILLYDAGDTIEYRFGKVKYPLGEPPQFVSEMDLKVPRARAENYQWEGFGRNMSYSVTVPNGNVSYRVFWSLDKLDKTNTPEGGVEVLENGKSIATVNCRGEIKSNLKGFTL